MNNFQKIARQMARSEQQSGQAIVLIAMLIVILLASLGLAIDGGGMFLMWRDAQNAADASALQAAYAYCIADGGNRLKSAIDSGMNAADLNGFDNVNTVDGGGNLISGNIVQVNWASQFEPYHSDPSLLPANAVDPNGLILVRIQVVKPAFFIQLVYGGPLTVTAEAMGACNPGTSAFAGKSIYTLGTDAGCGANPDESGVPPAPDDNNSQAPLYLSGDANLFSTIHSNGSVGVGGSQAHLWEDAQIEIAGGINLSGVSFIDGDEEAFDPPPATIYSEANNNIGEVVIDNDLPLPAGSFAPLYNIEDFAPAGFNGQVDDGEYYAAADALGLAHHLTQTGPAVKIGDEKNKGVVVPLEGYYFVEGDVTVVQGAELASKGISIVATGMIDFQANGSVMWEPYTDADLGTYPLLYSTNVSSPCSTSDHGVQVSANGIIMFGNIYAPNSGLYWSASKAIYCGAMVTYSVEISVSSSDGGFFFGDSIPNLQYLQDSGIVDTVEGGAIKSIDWTQVENRDCDFIGSGNSSFFIAK